MSTSPNRFLAIIIGSVYLILGILGFTVTAGMGLFSTTGGLLLGIFGVNAFHNLITLVFGAKLLLAGVSNVHAAKTVNTVVGAMCLVLGVAGLFVVGTAVNILALNAPDQVLHFGTALVLLGVGLGADHGQRPVAARP